jgi:hypothetical protein
MQKIFESPSLNANINLKVIKNLKDTHITITYINYVSQQKILGLNVTYCIEHH